MDQDENCSDTWTLHNSSYLIKFLFLNLGGAGGTQCHAVSGVVTGTPPQPLTARQCAHVRASAQGRSDCQPLIKPYIFTQPHF